MTTNDQQQTANRPAQYIPGETWPWDNCPAFVQLAMAFSPEDDAQEYLYADYMLWRVEKHGVNGMATFVGWIHPGLSRPDYEACDPINCVGGPQFKCATAVYLPGDTPVSPPGVKGLTPGSGKPTA